jgi:hypothetical protein
VQRWNEVRQKQMEDDAKERNDQSKKEAIQKQQDDHKKAIEEKNATPKK